MLQRIRDRISGWIAGVIIALVAGAFMLFGVQYYFDSGSADQGEVAKVNGVTISTQDLNNTFSQLQKQVMAETGGHPLPANMQQQLKQYALQSIINQTALQTTLEKAGFRVGLKQVEMMVEQAPEFQVQGKFSEQKMMQALYAASLTPAMFFQHVQTQWVIHTVMGSIANSAFVLPSEVNHYYALASQKRAFGYVIVPAHAFLSKTQVTEAEIKSSYDAHQAEYQTPAKVSVAYLMLSPAAIEKTITITPQAAQAYYESHQMNYRGHSFASIKANLIKLLQHQRVNTILSDKANQLSNLTYTNPNSLAVASKALGLPIQTSPMITKQGEKTGIFANPKILAAIFSHSVFESGNNSNPISLSDGTQIVLRIAKKEPSQPIPLATLQPKIKQQLMEKQAEAQAGLLAYQLQKKIEAGSDPVVLAKQNGLQWRAVSLTALNAKSATPAAIVSNAFLIPVSKSQVHTSMGVQASLFNQTDYAVIAVTQVRNADPLKANAAAKEKMAAQLSAIWGKMLQHCFGNSVIASAKITIKHKSA
ncbi:MAG: hypothetical protein COY58_07515 [Gammaproteobacteria bacterium CG_4_10_14_0_8_um_filter_38_16]|nr:MAG: hypothetical protein COY58_07515 [Gammaproteobacteria bacterium CG_4_10_14_0_8_um_filter_38_16]PJA02885.1 MAG: hypothetical protein COX72_08105 [Gammaproteobacteria bacterium CG_4_10_14_0_2_um_filter_38_22]PJB10951.1 MAG: hypothetical protein CO120_02120 [Gammaproteobacteria bacterium CG_4_9_14_3_um_filter_38_9]